MYQIGLGTTGQGESPSFGNNLAFFYSTTGTVLHSIFYLQKQQCTRNAQLLMFIKDWLHTILHVIPFLILKFCYFRHGPTSAFVHPISGISP